MKDSSSVILFQLLWAALVPNSNIEYAQYVQTLLQTSYRLHYRIDSSFHNLAHFINYHHLAPLRQ